MTRCYANGVRLSEGRYFGTSVHVASLAGLRISQAVYQPRLHLPRHSHAQPYLCLVSAGRFEERSGPRVETITMGSVVWNPPGQDHEDRFGNAGARTWNLEFSDAWDERVAQATGEWTPSHTAEASWLVTRLLRELSNSDTASALSLEGLTCALIGEVSRHPAERDPGRPSWLARAQDRLRAEYRHPPSVGELASEAGVHRSHFARAFRRFTGCTVAEFIRRLRIDWAAEQLRCEQSTLSEVSLQAGFGDQAHFTRTFKRMTGTTPGAYRAAAR